MNKSAFVVNVGMHLDCHSHVHNTSVHIGEVVANTHVSLEWLNTNYGCETTVAIGTMYTPGNSTSLSQSP